MCQCLAWRSLSTINLVPIPLLPFRNFLRSFDTCDRSQQTTQAVSACFQEPHYGFAHFTGRGAPEIDILEAMPGRGPIQGSAVRKPYFSTSLQIAPGVNSNRPMGGAFPAPGQWYSGLEYGDNSSINSLFYGVRNVKRPETRSYWSDAISANTPLGDSAWHGFHDYRLEWELPKPTYDPTSSIPDGAPDKHYGRGGHLRWFMDGELMYGIVGRSLRRKTGGKIPTEPSYLILNTAMSSTWGFPVPCPAHCPCECYDCSSADPKCTCGFAHGFCDSLPASFLVDHVRVYQSKRNDTSALAQKVGCSTPERPTRQWIAGHVSAYKDEWEKAPLQPTQRGGVRCYHNDDRSCNVGRGGGRCAIVKIRLLAHYYFGNGIWRCECNAGWTGPSCRARDGSDDRDWEADPFRYYSGQWCYLWRPIVLLFVPLAIAVCTLRFESTLLHMGARGFFGDFDDSTLSRHAVISGLRASRRNMRRKRSAPNLVPNLVDQIRSDQDWLSGTIVGDMDDAADSTW